MSTTVTVQSLPDCDVCASRGEKASAEYDGRTVYGPWAYMCGVCWREVGVGQLGTGYGQKLEVAE